MSDAMNDARCAEERWDKYRSGVYAFVDVLIEYIDPRGGLDDDALSEVNFAIACLSLKVARQSDQELSWVCWVPKEWHALAGGSEVQTRCGLVKPEHTGERRLERGKQPQADWICGRCTAPKQQQSNVGCPRL